MRSDSRTVRCLLLVAVAGLLGGCSELRARSHARDGNAHFKEGDYAAAVREYEAADRIRPDLPPVVLNKGLACRQLMAPGARSAENQRAADCALAAFSRLKRIVPSDPRGDQLYVQTLFDAERYETLAKMYQEQLRAKPTDTGSINGLIQVYSRWDRWQDALEWTKRRADMQPGDGEAQYAVGVFIWNVLFQKGGSGERASYDPRPDAKNQKLPPPFTEKDIVGQERIRLAEEGIAYLQKALALRPKYREAMTYLNLLYRQKSFAFFDAPAEWQQAVDAAESWRTKAVALDADHKPAPSPR